MLKTNINTKNKQINEGLKRFQSLIIVLSVTVGSDGPKNSVPQRGIEPWSLAFRVSVITTRPLRQLSAITSRRGSTRSLAFRRVS